MTAKRKPTTFYAPAQAGHVVGYRDTDGVAAYHFGGALIILKAAEQRSQVKALPVTLIDSPSARH